MRKGGYSKRRRRRAVRRAGTWHGGGGRGNPVDDVLQLLLKRLLPDPKAVSSAALMRKVASWLLPRLSRAVGGCAGSGGRRCGDLRENLVAGGRKNIHPAGRAVPASESD